MTYETAIVQLRAAQNGAEMLQVLDTLMTDFAAVESPQVDHVLAGGFHRTVGLMDNVLSVPTLEAVEF
jgi:hypothetical protein